MAKARKTSAENVEPAVVDGSNGNGAGTIVTGCAFCKQMILLGAQCLKSLYREHSYSYSPRPLPNHSDEGYRVILEMGKKNGIKCALHQAFLGGFKKGVDLGWCNLTLRVPSAP